MLSLCHGAQYFTFPRRSPSGQRLQTRSHRRLGAGSARWGAPAASSPQRRGPPGRPRPFRLRAPPRPLPPSLPPLPPPRSLLLPSLSPSFLRPCPAARGSERNGDAAAPPPAPEVSGEARRGSCCRCRPLLPRLAHRGAAPCPSPRILGGIFLASPGSVSVCVGTGGAASAAAAPCAGAAGGSSSACAASGSSGPPGGRGLAGPYLSGSFFFFFFFSSSSAGFSCRCCCRWGQREQCDCLGSWGISLFAFQLPCRCWCR